MTAQFWDTSHTKNSESGTSIFFQLSIFCTKEWSAVMWERPRCSWKVKKLLYDKLGTNQLELWIVTMRCKIGVRPEKNRSILMFLNKKINSWIGSLKLQFVMAGLATFRCKSAKCAKKICPARICKITIKSCVLCSTKYQKNVFRPKRNIHFVWNAECLPNICLPNSE